MLWRNSEVIASNDTTANVPTTEIEAVTKVLLDTHCSPAPTTLTHPALLLPELLTEIFTFLPPSTLILSAPLVCKTWHHVLSHPSLDLQTALYLRPADPGSVVDAQTKYGTRFNDIFTSIMPGYFEGSLSDFDGSTVPSFRCLPWVTRPAAWRQSASEDQDPSASRSRAIWRDMLICQPPIYQLGIRRGVRSDDLGKTFSACIRVPGGVTIGLIHDLLDYYIQSSRDPGVVSYVTELVPQKWLNVAEVETEWIRKRFDLWDPEKWMHFAIVVGLGKEDVPGRGEITEDCRVT